MSVIEPAAASNASSQPSYPIQHENNPHSKRGLEGHAHMARTFTWHQENHDSKREDLGQDIQFLTPRFYVCTATLYGFDVRE